MQRSPDGSTWTVLATLPANSTGYVDSGLNCATPYFYRVRVFNQSGEALSTVQTLSTQACPSPSTQFFPLLFFQ